MSDTDDERKARIMGKISHFYQKIENNRHFREKMEEKRKHETKDKTTKKKRKHPTEYQEQVGLVSVMRHVGLRFLHPNNNARNAVSARRAKSMGMVPGASDLLIFNSPPVKPDAKGVCIELKALDGRPSKAQYEFLQGMAQEGWLGFIVWGCDAGVKLLADLGYLNYDDYKGKNNDVRDRARETEKSGRRFASYQEVQAVARGKGDDSS